MQMAAFGLKDRFEGYTQSDFLIVPTAVAETFANVTDIFLDAGVYLECAIGPIVTLPECEQTSQLG
jgi:hypothetical protein